MQQSVIGPGMGIFTRYAKVLEDDDTTMTVRTALALINRVWEEIENELEANFDAETQVALAWFSTYGFDAKASGELITLANAKNIPLNALFASKVFQDHHGKAGLTPRGDLAITGHLLDLGKTGTAWQDRLRTVWGCLQHIIRVRRRRGRSGRSSHRPHRFKSIRCAPPCRAALSNRCAQGLAAGGLGLQRGGRGMAYPRRVRPESHC